MKTNVLIAGVLLSALNLAACSQAKFYGSQASNAKAPDSPTSPTTAPGQPTGTSTDHPTATPSDQPTASNPNSGNPDNPTGAADTPASNNQPPPSSIPPGSVPTCQDSERSVGAHVAFLIDNSNSNAATDCVDPQRTGTFNGAGVYECQDRTNREVAVLAAYDVLAAVAKNEASNAKAVSSLAIAAFPTKADFINGWNNETKNWLATDGSQRGSVSSAMQFTRKPYGLTPYGAAMTAAADIFKNVANDGKARVAVLVTDGEPTDRNPQSVLSQASALQAQGIKVITVFITGTQTRASRQAEHAQMMKGIDNASVQAGKGHWYTNAANFDAYIQSLIGGNGQPNLAEKISRQVVEVQDSTALQQAFLRIISTEAIRCEK